VAERPHLTDEQRAAVEVDGDAAVRAGAGSGKTTVLAHRYLSLLAPRPEGARVAGVARVLAITFTERAAAEMKGRIRELVAERLAGAEGAERAHWEIVRRDLLAAQISTIHAFCARVLRENPLEADLDPEATVLDEHESRAWLDAAIERELVARLRAGDVAAQALVRRHGLGGGRHGGALAILADLLAGLATAGRDATWLADADRAQAARAPAMAADVRAAADRIRAAIEARLAKGGKGKGIDALRAAWPDVAPWLARVDGTMSLEAFLLGADRLRRALTRARLTETAGDLRLENDRLRGRLPDAFGFLAARPLAAGLAMLVGHLADAVRARKRADSVLTFDDMIAETRTLLLNHATVRSRYATRFRAILVDEFQDTDAVQAHVIRLLVEAEPRPTVFIVGDEKQSIYRFRGADIDVFRKMRADLGRELPLPTNFRSQPRILHFVNALAARIMQPPGDAAPYWTRIDAADRLVPARAADDVGAVRLVSMRQAIEDRARGDKELNVAQARELEARVIAGVVAGLREENIRYGDVAILFRVLSQVKAYEYALRRREIPYYVVKGRGFFQCQEVGDVLALLSAVADPYDRIALATFLRSPFVALDDDALLALAWPPGAERPQLERRFRVGETFADLPREIATAAARVRDLLVALRRARHRATVAELLGEAFAATDFEAVLLTQFQGSQKVANVRKLIELARDLERRGLASLRDFVRRVRELERREPREPEAPLAAEDDDVVRLMTVHQAKGLEFRAVVIPDLGRQPPPETRDPVLDDTLGLLAQPLDGAGRIALANRALADFRAREADRERAESARLFYVACTRARDVLVLVEGKGEPTYLATGKPDPFRWCHQVWDLLGRERLAEFLASAACEATLAVAGEDGAPPAEIRIERADRWLEDAPGAAPAPPEPREAPPAEAADELVRAVVEFRPPRPDAVVTTPTALADYRRCPRQYWYRHVLALPERGPGGGAGATRLGVAAHGILETVDFAAAPDRGDLGARVDARAEALVLSARQRTALADDLFAAVRALAADVAAGLEIVGREVPFVLALPASAPAVVLRGRIDLLARRDGRFVVVDFKYAAPSERGVAGYADQLAAYQLAIARGRGGPVAAELRFLRGGSVVRALPACDPDAEERRLVEAGTALGAALHDGTADAFPRRPPNSDACIALGCGFVRRCWAPVTRRAADPPSDSAAS
jgi:ATP-dependent helicase/nuclease subunit A